MHCVPCRHNGGVCHRLGLRPVQHTFRAQRAQWTSPRAFDRGRFSSQDGFNAEAGRNSQTFANTEKKRLAFSPPSGSHKTPADLNINDVPATRDQFSVVSFSLVDGSICTEP